MAWSLTALTPEDRDLVVGTLRKEAERRDKAASTSALELVTSTEDGRISTRSAKAVRQLHMDAETLRSLAWDLEHQRDVPAVVEAGEVLEEERAATYPAPALVKAHDEIQQQLAKRLEADILASPDTSSKQRVTKSRQRTVKLVEFRDEAEERAAAMAAHPSNQSREEDQ